MQDSSQPRFLMWPALVRAARGRGAAWWVAGARSSTLWLFVAAVISSIVLLWPLPLQVWRVTLDFGDVLLEAWTLRAVHTALLSPGTPFFAAQSAYPLDSSLVLYQPLYTEALLSLPLYLAGWDPVAIVNVLVILSFVGSCWTTALLARQLTHSPLAGLIAGILFAFSQVRFAHLVHLNLLSGYWLPLILLVLLRVWQHPARFSWGGTIALGLLVAAQALADVYNAIYMAVAIGLLLLYQLITRRWGLSRAATLRLCVSGAIALALCAVIILPTLRAWKTLGLVRAFADHEQFSAHLMHYLAAARPRLLGYDIAQLAQPDPTAGGAEQTLWPGLITLVLALLGLIWTPRERRHTQGYFLCLALVAFGLSLGPTIMVNGADQGVGSLPYRWLYEWLPLFSAARVPSRWALLVQLALALLAAYGAAMLLRFPWRRALPRVALTGALFGLVLADTWSGTITGIDEVVLNETPAIYRTLATLPPGALLEWPMENADPLLPHRYQYFSLVHQRPLVNAAASIVPARYAELRAALARFPDPGAIVLLRDLGVRYVNINRWELSGWNGIRARLDQTMGLRLVSVTDDERHFLYEVLPDQAPQPAPVAVSAPAGDQADLAITLTTPLWLAPPAQLYAPNSAQTLQVRYSDGSRQNFVQVLPPILFPGTRHVTVPASKEIVELQIGAQTIPVRRN